eukprot:Gb_28378 [translate_table: standard]
MDAIEFWDFRFCEFREKISRDVKEKAEYRKAGSNISGMGQKQREGKSYEESLKELEADIHHANTFEVFESLAGKMASLGQWIQSLGNIWESRKLQYPSKAKVLTVPIGREMSDTTNLSEVHQWKASAFPREYDGACLQMRLSYSPAAHLFLFLVQWTDCSLASALGLLHILIYKVYVDGSTTISTHERKASLREFYAVIYPSLLQLQGGITEMEDHKQKSNCIERYKKKVDEERRQLSECDLEWEEECGICMETNSKIVLPNCSHAMCMNCYREWHSRSQSCPFCRDSLKRVNSRDLWIFTRIGEIVSINKQTGLRKLGQVTLLSFCLYGMLKSSCIVQSLHLLNYILDDSSSGVLLSGVEYGTQWR